MIAQELRRLSNRTPNAPYECCRDCYRLTLVPLGDLDRHLGFTLWEMRPRGWAAIVAGLVDDGDELLITFSDGPADGSTVALLADFLLRRDAAPAPALALHDGAAAALGA